VKNKSILLKARDFKYPNERERKQAIKNFPKLEKFEFEHKNDFELFISENLPAKEVHRLHNLYWWDECLGNKINFLRETYVYLITQSIRGLTNRENLDDQQLQLNTILFEYHLEVFYYFFFSTRDIVFQVVNLYFQIQESERIHDLKRFIERTPGKISKMALINFNSAEDVIKANEIRNSFTHRYTPTGTDYRLTHKIVEGKNILAGGGMQAESNQSFLSNIHGILKHLFMLLNELKKEIHPMT
jgi:hypothetical protein